MKLNFLIISLLFIAVLNIFSLENRIFSTDFRFSSMALKSHGLGLGMTYEQRLFDHISLTINIGMMWFETNESDVYCNTVNISCIPNIYLLSPDLNKLYIGFGSGCDYLQFWGENINIRENRNFIPYLATLAGWKQYIKKRFLVDLYVGYNYLLTDGRTSFDSSSRYGKYGFQYGFSFHYIF